MKRKTLCIVIALMVLSIGAILVAVEPELTGDVNRDGIVNILDLVEVASQFGEQGEPANTAANVGQFQNDLNGLPVNVTLSPLENAAVETVRARDLRANLWDNDGRFVRFTGVVDFVSTSVTDWTVIPFPKEVHELWLEGYPSIRVRPMDLPKLPEAYQSGQKYEFTGFLAAYTRHAEFEKTGFSTMRVYAFEIRHLGEAD